MRTLAVAIATSLAVAGCKKDKKTEPQTATESEAATEATDAGGTFKLRYDKASAELEPLLEEIRKERIFEALVEATNQSIRIPKDVTTVVKACDVVNAFYDPESNELTMCLEMIAEIGVRAAAAGLEGAEAGGPLIFIYFHELGHALIDVLALPITGKEEDAVDQLATALLVDEGIDDGLDAAIGGAVFFQSLADDRGFLDEFAFWGEHSLDEQRFYNIICWAYGAAPDKLGELVSEGVLPEERAQLCPDEFKKLKRGWETLLEKHVID